MYQLITCPKCLSIPKISLDLNFDIQCLCTNKDCQTSFKVHVDQLDKFKTNSLGNCCCGEIHKQQEQPAQVFCVECQSSFCEDCFKYQNPNHNYINTKVIMETICKIHEMKKRFYCKKCQSEICEICKMGEHKEHNVIIIKDIVNEQKVKEIYEDFDKLINKIDKENPLIFEQIKEEISEKIEIAENIFKHNKDIYENMFLEKIRVEEEKKNMIINFLQEKFKEIAINFEKNQNINKQLIEYFKLLHNNYFQITNNDNYNLSQNYVNNLIFNFNTYKYIKEEEKLPDLSSELILDNQINTFVQKLNSINDYFANDYIYNGITAIYDIEDNETEKENENAKVKLINILGDQFEGFNSQNCLIKLNNNDIDFAKEIVFSQKDINEINMIIKSNYNDLKYMFSFCQNIDDLGNYKCKNGSENLVSLDLSNLNTFNVINMKYMFACCKGLKSLDLGQFQTNNVQDMEGMFIGCESLTELDISNFNTENVNNMKFMFMACASLNDLNLSNFNTTNVNDMSFMFGHCYSLRNIELGSFDTTNVKDMKFMFTYCSSLTSINLNKFNTSNVCSMKYMFRECKSLSSLDLSTFNTTNVKDMEGMFGNCNALTTLDLSIFDTKKVCNMMFMFNECFSLKKIDFSFNFNTANVKNMESIFDHCYCITYLDLTSFDFTIVNNLKYMIRDCKQLKNIKINKNNKTKFAGKYYNAKEGFKKSNSKELVIDYV